MMKKIVLLIVVFSFFACKITNFIRAAEDGNLNKIEGSLNNGIDINIKDFFRRTALMSASIYGQSEIVKYLVSNGADVNLTDRKGKTALFLAAENGEKEIVEILVSAYADIDIVSYNIPSDSAILSYPELLVTEIPSK